MNIDDYVKCVVCPRLTTNEKFCSKECEDTYYEALADIHDMYEDRTDLHELDWIELNGK